MQRQFFFSCFFFLFFFQKKRISTKRFYYINFFINKLKEKIFMGVDVIVTIFNSVNAVRCCDQRY